MIYDLLLLCERILVKLSIFTGKVRRFLANKEDGEKEFWRLELEKVKAWYDGGKLFYNKNFPLDTEMVKEYDYTTNAILTARSFSFDKYLEVLKLDKNIFKGKRILDVGCGPFGYAAVFEGAQVCGLDDMFDYYKKIGYGRELGMELVQAKSEKMPFADNYFDAVISVNALDHVNNFEQTCKEIIRVLKPDGMIRFHIHYHIKTKDHPIVINEAIILKYLSVLNVKPLYEYEVESKFNAADPEEKMVIWTNFEN